MRQVESILAEISYNVWGTVEYLDVQDFIQAGNGKKAIGITYEADGADRANRIAAQMKKDLETHLHGLLSAHRVLMQMTTSSHKPVVLKEWVLLTSLAAEYCPLPGKWLDVPHQIDVTLDGSLKILIVLWVEHQGFLN